MATNFPGTLDDFLNPSAAAGDTLDNPPHDSQHANLNDAVEAIEAKVGVNGSTVVSTLDHLVKAAVDPGHTHSGSSAALADLDDRIGLTIIETSLGVWSGDAPARAAGVKPIEFRGASDPADPTNGITTPANINNGDTWIDTSV